MKYINIFIYILYYKSILKKGRYMKKYCNDCKYNKVYRSMFGESTHCYTPENLKIRHDYDKQYVDILYNQSTLNKNNNCPFYKTKWWKFWIIIRNIFQKDDAIKNKPTDIDEILERMKNELKSEYEKLVKKAYDVGYMDSYAGKKEKNLKGRILKGVK